MSSFPREVEGQLIQPPIVADSVFALSPKMIKCYPNSTKHREVSLNVSVVRPHRVVEQVYGCLGARFNVVGKSNTNDPEFSADISVFLFLFD